MDILWYPAISLKNAPNSLDLDISLRVPSGDASAQTRPSHEDCWLDTMRSAFWSNDRAWNHPVFWSRSYGLLGIIPNISTSKHSRKASMFYTKKKMLWWDVAFFSCFWHFFLLPDCFLRPLKADSKRHFMKCWGTNIQNTSWTVLLRDQRKEWNWRPFKKSTKKTCITSWCVFSLEMFTWRFLMFTTFSSLGRSSKSTAAPNSTLLVTSPVPKNLVPTWWCQVLRQIIEDPNVERDRKPQSITANLPCKPWCLQDWIRLSFLEFCCSNFQGVNETFTWLLRVEWGDNS